MIEIRNVRAYAIGASGSTSTYSAISGPPMRNQNTYTFGFNKFVKIPRLKEPDVSIWPSVGLGGSILKQSTPIFARKIAPAAEIISNARGFVANQPAANRLTMISGPSVKIGAAAVHKPALKPPESVSRNTIVNSGPGLTPSTTPNVAPAKARVRIGSISILSTP